MVSCFWFIYFNTCFCTSVSFWGSMNTTTTERTITETIAIENTVELVATQAATLLRAKSVQANLFDDLSRKIGSWKSLREQLE